MVKKIYKILKNKQDKDQDCFKSLTINNVCPYLF